MWCRIGTIVWSNIVGLVLWAVPSGVVYYSMVYYIDYGIWHNVVYNRVAYSSNYSMV